MSWANARRVRGMISSCMEEEYTQWSGRLQPAGDVARVLNPSEAATPAALSGGGRVENPSHTPPRALLRGGALGRLGQTRFVAVRGVVLDDAALGGAVDLGDSDRQRVGV